ncbi:MAG TPA: type I methionyl aminopeptidase [Longimicrobiales bacterium]|nr:type I methionyl aminopeptidase [Longimicrobiales bacterium]
MILLKSATEIEAIGRAGSIIGRLFEVLAPRVEPGVSTAELDALGEEFIRSHEGAVPAFKGLYGFPASLCISLNEEVVHGIPQRSRVLRSGDIVTLDAGVKLDGWFADSAITLPVGDVAPEIERLLDVTQRALDVGIEQAMPDHRIGDVAAAIQAVVEEAGFSVVRDLVGHGIGRDPHEEPQVPNYGKPGRGVRLREGLVVAIEPMVNAGGAAVHTLPDRWTVVTSDGSASAHFEHTVAVTAAGPRILTGSEAGVGR